MDSLSPRSQNLDLPLLSIVTPEDQPEFRFASLFEQDSRPENPSSQPLHVDSIADVDPTTDPEWLARRITCSFEAMQKRTKGSSEKRELASDFECNVCYEVAKDPVVTSCGHLFCWPCLYRRFHVDSKSFQECPVCEEKVNESSIVPIYGRGSTSEGGEEEEEKKSEGLKVPPRPRAKRVESQRQQQQIMYPRSAAQTLVHLEGHLFMHRLPLRSDEPVRLEGHLFRNNASGDNRHDSELMLRRLAMSARNEAFHSGTGPGTNVVHVSDERTRSTRTRSTTGELRIRNADAVSDGLNRMVTRSMTRRRLE